MILIAFSSRQLGFDPVIPALMTAIGESGKSVVGQDVDSTKIDPAVFTEKFEAVIVFDAFSWYFENRIKLQGRPWICSVSTCFDSLMPFMNVNVTEVGIDCFFTNCKTFFNQVSQVAISYFSYKPVAKPLQRSPDPMIGAVLPNVADRDFCLLARAFKYFQSIGDERRFKISLPTTELMRLPPVFPESVVMRSTSIESTARHLRSFSHMILCPRITDYRAGVLPEEILQAANSGVPTLCLHHQVLNGASKIIKPMAATLSEFDMLLAQIAKGESQFSVNADELLSPSAESFASLVLQAFERSKHAAT